MSQSKVQLVSNIVGNVSGGASFTGIVTASAFSGDVTGTATTATNLADAANITTGTIASARLSGSYGIDVTGTSAGLSGTPDIAVNNIVAAAATFSGNVSIAGTLTYEDVTNVDSIGVVTARSGVRIDAGGLIVTSGVSTFKGADFNGGSPLREKVNITAGKLSDNLNINLDNGMVHFFTTTETTTSTPNIYSSVGINTQLGIGDAAAVTIITTAAAAGYSTAINIDGVFNDVEWSGGTDPATGGASGKDVYALQIIKTGIGTFTVLGALNNFA